MTERRLGPLDPPPGARTVADPPDGATRVVLVRHGQAECNVNGVIGGVRGCSGLTDLGQQQVAALRDRLAATGELADVTAVWASVLPRAVQSAEILLPGLAGSTALEVRQECGLCELHPGEADGLTWSELDRRFGIVDFDREPARPVAPGGESWNGFVARATAALDRLVREDPGHRMVVVCHAGVVAASLLVHLARPDVGRLVLATQHASLTEWQVHQGRWTLLRYNDAAHLAAAGLSAQVRSSSATRNARSRD